MALTLDGLKIIKTAFPCDLALELFQAIKGHSGGIGPDEMKGMRIYRRRNVLGRRIGRHVLIGVKYFTGLVKIKDMLVRIRTDCLQESFGRFGEYDALATT